MKRKITTAVCLLALALSSGCGSLFCRSIESKKGGRGFFGDDPYSATCVEAGFLGIGLITGLGAAVLLLDLPLTFGLDTLFLPLDLGLAPEKPKPRPVVPPPARTVETRDDDTIVDGKEVVAPPEEELRSGEAK